MLQGNNQLTSQGPGTVRTHNRCYSQGPKVSENTVKVAIKDQELSEYGQGYNQGPESQCT